MKVFTVKQIAKICKVDPQMVVKWFRQGRLSGHLTPGSKDGYRAPREYLIKFMKEHGFPLGELENGDMMVVLIITQNQVMISHLRQELSPERSFNIVTAVDCFEAGVMAEHFHPDCVIIDCQIGKKEAMMICRYLTRSPDFKDVIRIALFPENDGPVSFETTMLNDSFTEPFEAVHVAERVHSLIETKRKILVGEEMGKY
jgi:PleD family two-component response regulator